MQDHGRVPCMNDCVYLSDYGGSGYYMYGPMPPPAVIDQCFVKHHLRWMPPLILIVYSRLDRRIQSTTAMLPLKRGRVVTHGLTAPPRLSMCILLTYLLFLLLHLFQVVSNVGKMVICHAIVQMVVRCLKVDVFSYFSQLSDVEFGIYSCINQQLYLQTRTLTADFL